MEEEEEEEGGFPIILRLPGEIIIILIWHNVLWVEVEAVRVEAGRGGGRREAAVGFAVLGAR